MHKSSNTSPENRRILIAKCLLALVWFTIIAVCLLHKDEFTLEGSISSPSAKNYKNNGNLKEWPMTKFWLGEQNDTPRTAEAELVNVSGNGFQMPGDGF